mmetsp:Transcript_3343/g.7472  ORF Transcript_3343/g.7472 Transcript_3343/m.7472 type:complete len:237 (-) Transcript_3343:421-1131(-)
MACGPMTTTMLLHKKPPTRMTKSRKWREKMPPKKWRKKSAPPAKLPRGRCWRGRWTTSCCRRLLPQPMGMRREQPRMPLGLSRGMLPGMSMWMPLKMPMPSWIGVMTTTTTILQSSPRTPTIPKVASLPMPTSTTPLSVPSRSRARATKTTTTISSRSGAMTLNPKRKHPMKIPTWWTTWGTPWGRRRPTAMHPMVQQKTRSMMQPKTRRRMRIPTIPTVARWASSSSSTKRPRYP